MSGTSRLAVAGGLALLCTSVVTHAQTPAGGAFPVVRLASLAVGSIQGIVQDERGAPVDGAVVSALWLAAAAQRTGRGRMVVIAGPSFGIAVALFALSSSFPLALLMLAATGFAMVLNNAATNTLLQHLVSDDLRGRVMSVWTFVFVGFAPIGSLWVGWLAGLISAPLALAASGVISALSVGWLWWKVVPEVGQLR